MNLAGLEADHPICRSGVVESLKQSVQSFGKWEGGRERLIIYDVFLFCIKCCILIESGRCD